MKIICNLLAVFVLVFTLSGGALGQDRFVAHVLEFEVDGKNDQANRLVDAFLANPIGDLKDFQKIFDAGLREKAIRVLLEKSGNASSGATAVLASNGNLDLINNKKRKIGEVRQLEVNVTPYLFGDDGKEQFIKADLSFERNAIDRRIPAGEVFVALDKRFYKTSIGNAFGQVTLLGGARTPGGNIHFLAVYFSK